ncbi:tetratricopeptide repeat protein [Nonomuraea sp. NPDC050394]|uniref:tetratricopeptide repeat protein n=1 Tax=Nonomuraea sp. NPDC050394 TaxID=3364363 RepID=UPI0037BA9385
MARQIFVGRTEEQERFASLLSALRDPADGPDEGFAVLVHGHGGMGKSTLVNRYVDMAAAAGLRGVLVDLDAEQVQDLDQAVGLWRASLVSTLERIAFELCPPGERRQGRAAGKEFEDFAAAVDALGESDQDAPEGEEADSGARAWTKGALELGGELVGDALFGVPLPTSPLDRMVDRGADALHRRKQQKAERLAREQARVARMRDQVVSAFAAGLRGLTGGRKGSPIAIFLDTAELLRPADHRRLREAIRLSGPGVVWVIAMRLEEELSPTEGNEASLYQRELPGTRFRRILMEVFDMGTLAEYLDRRLGPAADDLPVERIWRASRGIPLAVSMLCHEIESTGDVEDALAEIGENGEVSFVIRTLAERYLKHTHDPLERMLLFGMALHRSERLDASLLSALWDVGEPLAFARIMNELVRRHDFILTRTRRLHQAVRSTFRSFLLGPQDRYTVLEANRRAIEVLRERLAGQDGLDGTERLDDRAWRENVETLLWHAFWTDNVDGLRLMARLFPICVLDRGFAGDLLLTARFFEPVLTPDQREHLDTMQDMLRPGFTPYQKTLERTFALMDSARSDYSPVEGEIRAGLLDLLRLRHARWLSLDTGARIVLTERAAALLAGSSPAALEQVAQAAMEIARDLVDPANLRRSPSNDALRAAELATRYAPEAADAWRHLGLTALALGEQSRAEEAFATAVRLAADPASLAMGLGHDITALGYQGLALGFYREAAELKPGDEGAWTQLGLALRQYGRYAEAIRAFEAAGNDDEERFWPALHIWNSYHLSGPRVLELEHRGRARSILAEQLEHAPEDPSFLDWSCLMAEASEEHEQALALADRLTRVRPDNPDTHTYRGNALLALGRMEEAEAAYRMVVELDPEDFSAYGRLGSVLAQLDRPQEARRQWRLGLRILQAEVERNPGSGPMYEWLGALHSNLEEHEAAARAYQRVIEIGRTMFIGKQLADTLHALDRPQEAEAAYRMAIEMDAGNPYAYEGLGYVLRDLDRHAEAVVAWSTAVELTERRLERRPDASGLHYLAGILHACLRDVAASARSLEEAVRLDPEHAAAYLELGNAYFALGDNGAAESAYRAAIRISPDYARAHYLLGGHLTALCRLEEAAQVYRQGLRAGPDHSGIKAGLAVVHAMSGEAAVVSEADAANADHLDCAMVELMRGAPDAARAHLELAHAAERDGYRGYSVRLGVMLRRSDPERAERLLTQAAEPNPAHTGSEKDRHVRALALACLGRTDEAVRELEPLRGRDRADGYFRCFWDLLDDPPVPGRYRLLSLLDDLGRREFPDGWRTRSLS